METTIINNKSKLEKFFILVLVMSLVFNSTIYTSIHLFNLSFRFFLFLSSSVLFIISIYFLSSDISSLLKMYIRYIIVCAILLLDQLLRSEMPFNKVLLLIIFPLLILPFVVKERITNSNLFFVYFCNVMTVISVVSLFFTLLGLIGLSPNSGINSLWSGGTYVSGYFYLHFFPGGTQKIPFLVFSILRNSSIFPESPIFGYFLSLTLIFQNFIINPKRVMDKKSLIMYITIFTTASTTALMVALGVFVIKSVRGITEPHLRNIYLGLLVLLLLISLIFIIRLKLKNSFGSVSVRQDDFHAGLMAFLDKPLFGNGFKNMDSIETYMDANRLLYNSQSVASGMNKAGFSLGLSEMLALGGIYYAFFWLILPSCMYMFIQRTNLKVWVPLFNFLLVALLIINDTYMFIFTIIYFYVYGSSVNRISNT